MHMINKLSIDTTLLDQMPKQGISHPVPIIASDGNVYFLKNFKIDNGDIYDAMFFQEALATQLAQAINLPVPDWAIITIDNQTLTDFPELRFEYQFVPGQYYASRKISGNIIDLVNVVNEAAQLKIRGSVQKLHNIFSKIKNKQDIPKIILFDFWTLNIDRFTNSGNLILRNDNDGNYLLSIDFGHCFNGPKWDKNTQNFFNQLIQAIKDQHELQFCADLTKGYLNLSQSHGQLRWKLGIIFNELERQIQFSNSINPFSKSEFDIRSISDSKLTLILNSIPAPWITDGSTQKEAYFSFLKNQRAILPNLIQYLADQKIFTNYNGGTLTWHQEKNISTQ